VLRGVESGRSSLLFDSDAPGKCRDDSATGRDGCTADFRSEDDRSTSRCGPGCRDAGKLGFSRMRTSLGTLRANDCGYVFSSWTVGNCAAVSSKVIIGARPADPHCPA